MSTAPPQPPSPPSSDDDDGALATANGTAASPSTTALSTTTPPSKAKKKKHKKKKPKDTSSSPFPTPDLTLPPSSPSAERDNDLLYPLIGLTHLRYSPLVGRHLVASQPLPPSSLAVYDRGYARCIKLTVSKEVCAYCFLSIDALPTSTAFTPCSTCRIASYCSPICAHLAQPYHSIECPLLTHVVPISRRYDVDVDLLQMLVNVIGRHHRELHRNDFPTIDMRTTPIDRLSDHAGKDDDLTLAHVMDLVYHSHLFTSAWRQSVTAAAAALLPFSPFPSSLTPSTLLEVAMRINGNAHSLVDCSGNSAIIGLGLYPRVSLLNHSCHPTCHYSAQRWGVMEVRVRQLVGEGEELTVHYCDLYESREDRGRQLMREKGFVCRCTRCTEDIRSSVDRLVGGVYCPCQAPPQRSSTPGEAAEGSGKRVGSSREEVEAEMPLPSPSAPLILFIGDVAKPADDLRRDYQCGRCGKKYSTVGVTELMQPLVVRHQAATQHKAGGRLREAMEGLEGLLAYNRQQSTVTAYHPLLLSSYVLLYNLAMRRRVYGAAVRWARHVVCAYRAVFPEGFMETGDWLYAEGLACDAAWKELKGKVGGGKGADRVVDRWKEERNRALAECWQIRALCGHSPQPLSNQLQVVP